MIKIFFYPGTHGNFLEFVLNKCLFGDQIIRVDTLGKLGTSHDQRSDDNYQNHRFFRVQNPNKSLSLLSPEEQAIKIDFDLNDDLTVFQLNLKRGEDFNIDVDTLTHDTFGKLYGKYGDSLTSPHDMIACINQYSDLTPYRNIKDPSWPDIACVDEFYNLPKEVQDECKNVFGFQPFYLCEKYPDAPRSVLVSIFKTWFDHGSAFKQMDQDCSARLYKIPLRSLYDFDMLSNEIEEISRFFDLRLQPFVNLKSLHERFTNLVPYKNSLEKCNQVIESVKKGLDRPVSLNVLEESYVIWRLENLLQGRCAELSNDFFASTMEIKRSIILDQ